jgi:hypothetical protein
MWKVDSEEICSSDIFINELISVFKYYDLNDKDRVEYVKSSMIEGVVKAVHKHLHPKWKASMDQIKMQTGRSFPAIHPHAAWKHEQEQAEQEQEEEESQESSTSTYYEEEFSREDFFLINPLQSSYCLPCKKADFAERSGSYCFSTLKMISLAPTTTGLLLLPTTTSLLLLLPQHMPWLLKQTSPSSIPPFSNLLKTSSTGCKLKSSITGKISPK